MVNQMEDSQSKPIRHSYEVSRALSDGTPVVALESTVYSTLGLPAPQNREAVERSVAALSERGATAAITAVIDGEFWCGVDTADIDRILTATAKTAERDLAVAVGQGWPVGVLSLIHI